MRLVTPSFWEHPDSEENVVKFHLWKQAMEFAEHIYADLIAAGDKPQEARSVLPNSLKTEIVVSANFREWRHIFRMGTSKRADPQMYEVMRPLLKELRGMVPVIFEDVGTTEGY